MVHGYHVILPTYGFWLPADPRGTWTDVIRKWEQCVEGHRGRSDERRPLDDLSDDELRQREQLRRSLKYPPVRLTGVQAISVSNGFAALTRKNGYTVWACSILPEHTHLVIARHRYRCEQMANLLKGAATSRLIDDGRHPLGDHAAPGKRPPRMWAEHQWIVYLESTSDVERSIDYTEGNAAKEGKRTQSWRFVTPFAGLPTGWVTYHSD